jgi:predicted dehydrogenase
MVPALKQARDTQIVGVYSRDLNRARTFADANGISGAYDSLDGMLRDPRKDAVFITSPNSLHMQHAFKSSADRKDRRNKPCGNRIKKKGGAPESIGCLTR